MKQVSFREEPFTAVEQDPSAFPRTQGQGYRGQLGRDKWVHPTKAFISPGSAPLLAVMALATLQASSRLITASLAARWPRGTRVG